MDEQQGLARPYFHLLEGRDPIAVLRATPGRISRVLKELSPESVEHKDTPGKWSVREVLCHLADCEIAWAWRLRRVYEGDSPVIQPFDQDLWAKAYGSPGYTTEAAKATWTSLRRWNLALLDGLTDDQKHRPATHPERGPETLWAVAEIAAGHDLHHLASLEKLTSRSAGGSGS